MKARITALADAFVNTLRNCQEECSATIYEGNVQIQLVQRLKIPLHNIKSPVLVCEKAIPKPERDDETENSEVEDPAEPLLNQGPQGLTVTKARQLLSYYVISQNPTMCQGRNLALCPLWVRCDSSDSEGTCWVGAETICNGNKVTAVKMLNVSSKGPAIGKTSLITLEELKHTHTKMHRPTTMTTRGFATYNLFGSTVVENTVIESQSTVTVDFKWSNVQSILQTPPLSSTATLNIRIASGDMRSPIYEQYKEMEFVQILADGVSTGGTDWVEPLDTVPAMELVKALIDDLQIKTKAVQNQSLDGNQIPKARTESSSVDSSVFSTVLTERGDLDFVEQLWVKMRRSVTSYQDIVDCLKLVIKALKYDNIKPWIHRESSSSLSKLILKSYSKELQPVGLTGLAPVRMLLETGLDKMRRDYINYFVGQQLTTLKGLSYYLNTEVDLLEQVVRVKKLHHLLEMVVTCGTFLSLAYEHLFALSQSCLEHYETNPYDEDHRFQLQIRPAVISSFYQKEQPLMWGMEVSSGQGPKEVKTSWQLSDRCPVDHVNTDSTDFPFEVTVNGDCEESVHFETRSLCSLVSFA
ncbi:protein zwilch homolog [Paramormyrops kingsleyae]|uniref:Protein zwilch n=1 Tax=Paramormyrops kingsleyae TaxID=1676925 RepID=A0A3B3S0X2_9TELE|nr:protein zwilch homolog [Paramormyrops kingsleyae]